MEIEDVFDERMTPGRVMASRRWNRSFLTAASSTIASNDVVDVLQSVQVAAGREPAERGVTVLGFELPFSTNLPGSSRSCRAPDRAPRAAASTNRTSYPDCAKTWAIPLPMVPAPITHTFDVCHPAGVGDFRRAAATVAPGFRA